MVNGINSWVKGIIIAVIISTVVEMIIPNGNIKKYIKTVIGVYIVFTIISPIVSKITGKEIKLSSYIHNVVTENNGQKTATHLDTNKYIKQTYIENLEKEIEKSIEEKGYKASKIKVEIEEGNDEYGKINKLKLSISKNNTNIEPIQISVGNQKNNDKKKLTEIEEKELKDFLSDEYGVEKENININ